MTRHAQMLSQPKVDLRRKAKRNEVEVECASNGDWYALLYEENGDVVCAGPCGSASEAVVELLRG